MAERPMRADARRNYERLVAAAAEVFAERGEAGTTEEVAKRAGVGPGTLYRHFPTREDLVAAAYRSGLEASAARGHELVEECPPGQALRAWMGVMVEYWQACGELKTLMGAIFGADSELQAECRALMFGAADAVLADARAAGTVRADLSSAELLRLLHAVVLAAGSKAGAGPVAADRMVELVVGGLERRG